MLRPGSLLANLGLKHRARDAIATERLEQVDLVLLVQLSKQLLELDSALLNDGDELLWSHHAKFTGLATDDLGRHSHVVGKSVLRFVDTSGLVVKLNRVSLVICLPEGMIILFIGELDTLDCSHHWLVALVGRDLIDDFD